MARFGVTQTVATLALTLFSLGLATGPLVIGPLSEVYGRNIIYRVSFGLLFAFSWPVAFAPNACKCDLLQYRNPPITTFFWNSCLLPISIRDWAVRLRILHRVGGHCRGYVCQCRSRKVWVLLDALFAI